MSDSATPSTQHNHNHVRPPPSESPPHWGPDKAVVNMQSALEAGDAQAHDSLRPAASATVFRSNTISPSPPPTFSMPPHDRSNYPGLDIAARRQASPSTPGMASSPLSASLRIQTDIPGYTVTAASAVTPVPYPVELHPAPNTIAIPRTPSVKKILASSFGTSPNLGSAPNSVVSSPMLNAISDVTPLPSPLMSGDSPGPWKKLSSRPASIEEVLPIMNDSALVTATGESISSALANQAKRLAYHGLGINDAGLQGTVLNREKHIQGHNRNRSLSDYVPEPIQGLKPRNVAVSGSHGHMMLDPTPETSTPGDTPMRREPHLALQRGLAPIPSRPPTPPSSRTGGESSDSDSSITAAKKSRAMKPRCEYFEAQSRDGTRKRTWRTVKALGTGTFSRVVLATSELEEEGNAKEEPFGDKMEGILTPITEDKLDRKNLVAIKICEHGPKGGASEERVEMSLKRELEIMKTIRHPSLVHLKAWSIEETRALLVLSYCPGGDLFEVASDSRNLMVPALLRRIFAELVGAVRYLHGAHIVHRDIKLENVLVNVPSHELARNQDWTKYPHSIITLTDLGLSRYVVDDEKLTTRCGSDDYAAPEVILGQPYDGRAIDAWSLGVLLYALLEKRLPFDVHPNMSETQRSRSRTSHRIARIEWSWVEYAGDEGDHEAGTDKFKAVGLEGAMKATEGLLKRARHRWTLEQVAQLEWVSGAIAIEGGIQFREEDNVEVFDINSPPM